MCGISIELLLTSHNVFKFNYQVIQLVGKGSFLAHLNIFIGQCLINNQNELNSNNDIIHRSKKKTIHNILSFLISESENIDRTIFSPFTPKKLWPMKAGIKYCSVFYFLIEFLYFHYKNLVDCKLFF